MGPGDEEEGQGEAAEFECPECGAILSEGADKCLSCGIEFDWGEEFECPECGTWMPSDANACPECGLAFEALEEPEEVVATEVVEAAEEAEEPEVPAEPTVIEAKELQEVGEDEEAAPVEDSELLQRLGLTDVLESAEDIVKEEKEEERPPIALTNGEGFINGRDYTAGEGLTNGQGLTKGTDLVYDTGLVNGTGMTEAHGLTNGAGLTNGTGLINGTGLTNGEGLTNGLATPEEMLEGEPEPLIPRIPPRYRRKRTPEALAFIVILLLVLAAVLVSIPKEEENIIIDASFGDWADVPRFTDRAGGEGSDNVDIKEWAVDATGDEFSVLVRVAGRMLSGKGEGADSVQVFIDSDRTSSTGYAARGIGAEHLIEVSGWEGAVHTASLSSWSGRVDTHDLAGFEGAGGLEAASGSDSLELQVSTESLGMSDEDTPVRVLIRVSEGSSGSEDWTDTAVNQVGPSLEVGQHQEGSDLSLDLRAHGGTVSVRSIKVHYLGVNAEGLPSAMIEGSVLKGSRGSTSTLQLASPLELTADTQMTIEIENNLTGSGAAQPIVLSGDDIQVDGSAEVYVAPPEDWTAVTVLPVQTGEIRIDGSFEDWDAIGGTETDPPDDLANALGATVDNPNVDILGHNSVLTPVGTSPTHLSCYVSTAGEVLGGMVIQSMARVKPGPPGPPGPTPPPVDHLYLEDRTVIYIDVDPGPTLTGLRVAPGVGADYMIDIKGKFGRILPGGAALRNYEIGEWQLVTDVDVPVGLDRDELEVKVSLDYFTGLGLGDDVRTFFYTTDWSGNYDDALEEVRASEHHIKTWERPAQQDQKVWPGDTDVPVLRIMMESASPVKADILLVRAALHGTLGSEHVTAVRVWASMGAPEELDTAAARVVASSGDWDGDVIEVPFEPPLTVAQGELVTLFVAVDIGPDAPSLEWFDLTVVHDHGLEATLPVRAEEAHAPYRFVRVWSEEYGRALPDHVVLNEIRSDGTWKYCEIYNPKSTAWNVEDYYAKMEHNTETDYTLLTFEDKTMASESLYAETLDNAVDYDESGWWVTLYDASNNEIDVIPMPGSWVSSGHSWCRYKDQSGDPYYSAQNASGDWYDSSSPTLESANDKTIPEFEEVMVPVLGTLVIVTVLRRRGLRRGRED